MDAETRDRVLQALGLVDSRAQRLRFQAEATFAGVTRHKAPPPHVQSSHGRKGPRGLAKKALSAAAGMAKGRDLTGDHDVALAARAAARKADQDIDAFDGPQGNMAFIAIADRQGFNGPPTVTSDIPEFEKIRSEGGIALFRGQGWVKAGGTGQHQSARLLYGDRFAGGGHGVGTNMSNDAFNAAYYADDSPGATVGFLLRPAASVVSYPDLNAERDAYLESLPPGRKFDAERAVYADLGRYAAARGYDAMVVRQGESPLLKRAGREEWVVFNRTALVAWDDGGHLAEYWQREGKKRAGVL